jgi:hypothetical protein
MNEAVMFSELSERCTVVLFTREVNPRSMHFRVKPEHREMLLAHSSPGELERERHAFTLSGEPAARAISIKEWQAGRELPSPVRIDSLTSPEEKWAALFTYVGRPSMRYAPFHLDIRNRASGELGISIDGSTGRHTLQEVANGILWISNEYLLLAPPTEHRELKRMLVCALPD